MDPDWTANERSSDRSDPLATGLLHSRYDRNSVFGLVTSGVIYHQLLDVFNIRNKYKCWRRNGSQQQCIVTKLRKPKSKHRTNTNTHTTNMSKRWQNSYTTQQHRWRCYRRPCLRHRIQYKFVLFILNIFQILLHEKFTFYFALENDPRLWINVMSLLSKLVIYRYGVWEYDHLFWTVSEVCVVRRIELCTQIR